MSIAVRSAQEAVKLEGRPVLVAGSNTAAEDCYQPNRKISPAQLHRNHLDHITRLHALGVDFILNETLGHADEIELTSQIC
jgi:S-methylmethionine-dependent homocysteine/selenocysteine methylase